MYQLRKYSTCTNTSGGIRREFDEWYVITDAVLHTLECIPLVHKCGLVAC